MHDRQRRCTPSLRSWAPLSFLAAVAFALPLHAQPRIQHDALECLSRESFTRILARIEPGESIRAAKVYFRSTLYADYYFVEMERALDGFEAVIPVPSDDTSRVAYYIEAVDFSFQTARSLELETTVSGDGSCRPGPGGALFPGGDPGIVVGATRAGAAALPPGFQASGIVGFLAATGQVAAAGGGISTGVVVAAVAGAAGGAGVLAGAGGESSTSTTSPATGGNGTSSVGATTTVPSTSSSPPTTTVSGGATTSIGPTTTTPGTTTGPPTTTAASTSTALPTTSAPALNACFQWEALGNCMVSFESCSEPVSEIVRYEWRMLGPPVPDPPEDPSFVFSFEADPRCQLLPQFVVPVRLTVFGLAGQSDSVQQNVDVLAGSTHRTARRESVRLAFVSRLVTPSPDAGTRVQFLVNGFALPPMEGASPAPHQFPVESGLVSMEATFTTPPPPSSLLEIDFSSGGGLVPWSLQVESGALAAKADQRIVFRLNGQAGEQIRFRFRVR